MIDALYLYKHSPHDDLELRYSLRSITQNLPFIRKTWIFGDKPHWLKKHPTVQHIPVATIAPALTATRDDFTLLFLASHIPDLAPVFLRFADDYIILKPLTPQHFAKPRALQDLSKTGRGTGKWKDQLWRTYDMLKAHGYPGINFEAHVPQAITRTQILETYLTFAQYTRTERYGGILAETAIFNHHRSEFTWVHEEGSRAAFYGKEPSDSQLAENAKDRLFLGYDDPAFTDSMWAFLQGLFPTPCVFEQI